MYVRIQGIGTSGRRETSEWQLLAEHNHGPYVPVLATVALIRKLVMTGPPRVGAMPCMGLVTLKEICAEFGTLEISTLEKKTPAMPTSFKSIVQWKNQVTGSKFSLRRSSPSSRSNTSMKDRNSMSS